MSAKKMLRKAFASRIKMSCIKRIPVLHAGATQVVGRCRLLPPSLRVCTSPSRDTQTREEEEVVVEEEVECFTKTHTNTLSLQLCGWGCGGGERGVWWGEAGGGGVYACVCICVWGGGHRTKANAWYRPPKPRFFFGFSPFFLRLFLLHISADRPMQRQPHSPVWAPSQPGFPTPAECGLTPFREVWHGAGTFPHSSPTTKAHRLLFALLGLLGALPFIVHRAGFVSRVKPGSTAGIGEGREEVYWTDGHTIYLPARIEGNPEETMRRRGCNVTGSPWMVPKGQVQGPVAWSVAWGTALLGWSFLQKLQLSIPHEV